MIDPRTENGGTYLGHSRSSLVPCSEGGKCTVKSCIHRKPHYRRQYDGMCWRNFQYCSTDLILCDKTDKPVQCLPPYLVLIRRKKQ